MAHRVDDLRVAVRGRSAALKDAAADFASRVLERAGDRLEERFPARVVDVRRLPLALRVAEDALDGGVEVEDAAARLADRLAAYQGQGEEVAVFADEALRRAAFLALPVRAACPWWADDCAALPGPAAVATVGLDDAQVWMLLTDLHQRALLTGILARWSEADLVTLLGRLSPPARLLSERAQAAARASTQVVAELRGWRRRLRAVPVAAFTIVALVRLRCEEGLEDEEAHALVALALAAGGNAGGTPSSPAVIPAAGTPSSPSAGGAAADMPVPAAGMAAAHGIASAAAHPATPLAADAPLVFAGDGSGAVSRTAYAGLAYLLARTGECGVAEALWRACLPEGAVLAQAWAPLAGDDPIVALLSGQPDTACPIMEPEQAEEISALISAGTSAALAHRGLCDPLALHLRLVEPRGLVVAQLVGSRAVLAAWPQTRHQQALEAVVDRWRGATWTADPALAQLHPALTAATPELPAPLLPASADAATAAILAMVVGAPLAVLCARARLAAADVPACLAIAGSLHDDGGTIRITMPASAIDVRLRRAGLDADPGHVPWLRRQVRLVFAGGEEF